MTRNQKNNYIEIMMLSRFRDKEKTIEPIAKRLMDRKAKVRVWCILHEIVLNCPNNRSWLKISCYLSKANDEEFDKFFDLAQKTRDLKLEDFIDISDKSKASGLDLLIFYKNLIEWEPRCNQSGRKNNANNYRRLKHIIRNDPHVDLTKLGFIFNNENYITRYTGNLI